MSTIRKAVAALSSFALLFLGCGPPKDQTDTSEKTSVGSPSREKKLVNSPGDVSGITGQTLSPAQNARHRILEEILQLVGNPEEGLKRDDWNRIKSRYWLPDYDRVISANANEVGVLDLLKVAKGKSPLVVQLLSGNFESRNATEQDSLLALHTSALLITAKGGLSLPVAVRERINDPAVTYGDVILFEIFNDAFQEFPRPSEFTEEAWADWQLLSSSQNAVFRLLALRTFRRVAHDPEKWLAFYRLYINETDCGILTELIDQVFETAKPGSVDVLEAIRSRNYGTMPQALGEKLTRSIEFLSQYTQKP